MWGTELQNTRGTGNCAWGPNVQATPASTIVRVTPAATTRAHRRHQTHHVEEVDDTRVWKVEEDSSRVVDPTPRGVRGKT